MSVLFGTDISHHNRGFDFARARREGVLFTLLKATEGATYVDPTFSTNLAAAHAAGLLTGAYHYQRADSTVAAQVANIKRHVPRDVPLAIDVERNSGGPDITRGLVAGLRAEGYRVILTYFPRWYWQQLGSPSLAGLPPLWSSRYPDNIVGSIADEYADVPASYWTGYGGLDVAVLQFSSSGAVANFTTGRIDTNAFRGTPAALAALFGGTTSKEDDELSWDQKFTAPNGKAFSAWEYLVWGNFYASNAATGIVALTTLVGDITKSPDITADAVAQMIDTSVARHSPTAQQTAAALLPLVESIATTVLGADNEEQAKEILRQLGAELA
ncbi:glycoside hydrolase family 25 protein, partial [Actinokineospora sp.]|uniref:glycoside hydrolase family 25 protein n=1 Tax=Actinokineospora sp. TaxID=1872133 RepID=UPI003D6A941D